MKSNILFITGVYPPQKCGVADYLYKIFNSNRTANFKLYYDENWEMRSFLNKVRSINSYNTKVINIQYPTAAYLYSFLPHLLCLYFYFFSSKTVSVTLHEFSHMGWKGRLCNYVFLIFSNKLIFTNDFELKYASKYIPFIKKKSTVIRIKSNIKSIDNTAPISDRKYDVGYFGLIRDNKGIEQFIETVSQLRKEINKELSVYIMGQTQEVHQQYQNSIFCFAEQLGIKLILNKSEDDVAEILANTKIVYLPFPDGVSERRGSFLAAINNRCLVITTRGKQTTPEHNEISFISKTQGAASLIISILNQDTNFFDQKQRQIDLFLSTNSTNSWEDISTSYNEFLLS